MILDQSACMSAIRNFEDSTWVTMRQKRPLPHDKSPLLALPQNKMGCSWAGHAECATLDCVLLLQDPMTRPLQLQCKHAFCEACITEWLERELTCPMCRTQIKAPGNEFKSGSISLFPQIL